jgi:hypothetical protein
MSKDEVDRLLGESRFRGSEHAVFYFTFSPFSLSVGYRYSDWKVAEVDVWDLAP